MTRSRVFSLFLCYFVLMSWSGAIAHEPLQLSKLTPQQTISAFHVNALYSDATGRIVGVKLSHSRTGTPVFLLQMETVPKALFWVDTPDRSDRGVPHALEHLVLGKGTQGRYLTLLTNMRLSESTAGTYRDFTFYSFSSGTGTDGFFEELHAWLGALFRADFTDTEAEREIYHLGVSKTADEQLTLVDQGSVYDEIQPRQSKEAFYFELNKRLLGSENPLAYDIRGLADSMRDVTPRDIRQFYQTHYHLGPNSGFIFVVDPKVDIRNLLARIAKEFDQFAQPGLAPRQSEKQDKPKYPIESSEDTSIGIYPFPSQQETQAGAVRLGWRPVKANSPMELKLLELLFRGLASDPNSLLYRAVVDSKTRELDLGATGIDCDVFVHNSPSFPFVEVELSGIPSDRISVEQVEKLRKLATTKIKEISQYPDHSADLLSFNQLVGSYAYAARRSENVWIKTPPMFGIDLNPEWKDHLGRVDMDESFVKSLVEDPAWNGIEKKLRSGENFWRNVIFEFHLLDEPFATASKASLQLLREQEKEQQNRILKKIAALRELYHTSDDQEALALFERDEIQKTQEIDAIQARVRRPSFTNRPPLTADDEIVYRESVIGGAPSVASIFDRPPTIDIGLAFDLRKIPRRYYKYLPILPRSFDSLGLQNGQLAVSYPELLSEIQRKTLKFSIGYEQNASSKRADLVFRISVMNVEEVAPALRLVSQMMQSSRLDPSTLDRLRDLIARRLSADEAFKSDEFRWMQNAAYGFLTQKDELFQAVYSTFTRTHWDERMKWRLHEPVNQSEINQLASFTAQVLSNNANAPAAEIGHQLERSDLSTLERELLEYWKKTLPLLPESGVTEGLEELTSEVQEDLRAGPAQTMLDIKELQKLALNRDALHIDLLVDKNTLDEITPGLEELAKSLSGEPQPYAGSDQHQSPEFPITAKLVHRYHLSQLDFPWYVGFVNKDGTRGDMVSYSDLPGYSQLDRDSLIKVLSSKIFADDGPQSLYIKTREAGLAYAVMLTSNPAYQLLWDYADRSPDIPALVALLNGIAKRAADLRDPAVLDYALRQTFEVPRSIYPPSVRAQSIAQDLRDGFEPDKVRRFSEAILNLRKDPQLLSELTSAGEKSICGILLIEKCKADERNSHSIFFFVGSEKTLSDLEKRLSIPNLLRVWPSDYWLP